MHSKTLPTLNKVIIKCVVHYIVHLQCNLSLSRMYECKGFGRFSVGMGSKEIESSTGRVLVAGIHHIAAHSHLACIFFYEPFISLNVHFFFGYTVDN
jgi:hypothetical protein